MERTRAICSAGSGLRKTHNLRVRQPLAGMTVAVPGAQALAGTFQEIVADELNLKSVTLVDADEVSAADYGISQELKVNARAAGPRLGKQVQQVIRATKAGDWFVSEDGGVVAGSVVLEEGEYELVTVVDDAAASSARAVTVLPGGGFLVLDTELTDELRAEGVARDMVRAIQQARKDAGLVVSDRIRTTVHADAATLAAVDAHRELVQGETLTRELELVEATDLDVTVAVVDA